MGAGEAVQVWAQVGDAESLLPGPLSSASGTKSLGWLSSWISAEDIYIYDKMLTFFFSAAKNTQP